MRAVDVAGTEIDAPWLLDGESFLLVNGVDVTPYVEAALNRRFPGYEADGNDMSVFATVTPSYADVLDVRAGRVAMVRRFLGDATSEDLAATRKDPWDPDCRESTSSCLHVILEEEWEHHRYAVRDLDAIEAKFTSGATG